MPTYPNPNDPRSAMTRADGTTVRHSFDHGSLIDRELNVKYFGVKGDGSDDTAAIQDALDAVLIPTSEHFTKTLVFPWTDSAYEFGDLDWNEALRVGASDRWITIRIEGKLRPQTTMLLSPRRLHIVGGSGATHVNFSSRGYTEIDGSDLGTDPVIMFTEDGATSMVLEGFMLKNFLGNGLLTPGGGNQPEIRMKRMWFQQSSSATGDYSCVKVTGSPQDNFDYSFVECGFDTSSDTGFGLELEDTGLTTVEDCYFGSRGISMTSVDGTCGTTTIRSILCESLDGSFLTLDSTNGLVQGIYLERVENADSLQSPTSCLLKNTGTQTHRVVAFNCGGYTRLLESGSDPIEGLFQSPSASTSGTTIGQTNQYENVDRFGRHQFAVPVSFVSLDATAADTTPSAGEISFYVLTNGGAVTITDFDNEVDGQIMYLLFTDANTTIDHNANVKLAGGLDFVGSANDTLTLISRAGVWYEVARSVNG
jgi:hypothetical protein